jgi:peptide/nickel transport system permease protein
MLGYIIRRLIQAIFIGIGVTLIVFVLLQLLNASSGSVAKAVLGPRATPVAIAQFNHENGLDQAWPLQYLTYLGQVTGLGPVFAGQGWQGFNFGHSYNLNQDVSSLLAQDVPKTLLLVGLGYIVAIVVAVPLGIYQAVRRNKPDDYVLTSIAFIFYSMPVFWLGIILIIIFAATLHWLPALVPEVSSVGDLFPSQLPSLILPVLTIALLEIALFSRYMRSAVLENMVQDYVRTARAKGASQTRVLFVHVLRNALIPVLTLIGLSIGFVFAGALVVEALFNYPGLGLLFWHSAQTKDYPVLLGVILITGIATVLGNLLADVMYAVADPRVRYAR